MTWSEYPSCLTWQQSVLFHIRYSVWLRCTSMTLMFSVALLGEGLKNVRKKPWFLVSVYFNSCVYYVTIDLIQCAYAFLWYWIHKFKPRTNVVNYPLPSPPYPLALHVNKVLQLNPTLPVSKESQHLTSAYSITPSLLLVNKLPDPDKRVHHQGIRADIIIRS